MYERQFVAMEILTEDAYQTLQLYFALRKTRKACRRTQISLQPQIKTPFLTNGSHPLHLLFGIDLNTSAKVKTMGKQFASFHKYYGKIVE